MPTPITAAITAAIDASPYLQGLEPRALAFEVLCFLSPSSVRGSLQPALTIPPDIELDQLPAAEDQPLDEETGNLLPFLIEQNAEALSRRDRRLGEAYLAQYGQWSEALRMPNRRLLGSALTSDLITTGICGETANRIASFAGDDGGVRTDLAGLLDLLQTDQRHVQALVTIGRSHRFFLEAIDGNVDILQSWVGRFSFARWFTGGRHRLPRRAAAGALREAFPLQRDGRDNAGYSRLFCIDATTPSPHVAGEVGVDLLAPRTDAAGRIADAIADGAARWGIAGSAVAHRK